MKRPWPARTALSFLLLLAGGCAPAAQASWHPASPPPSGIVLEKGYGTIPVHFEENRGQAPSDIRFVARTATGRVLLAPDGLVVGVNGTPVRLSFAGGSVAPAIEALEPLTARVHYYSGPDPKDWRTDVRTYSRVRYAAVYPGIDVIVYGNQRQLEYDFIVAPGADPTRIRLAVTGVSELIVDAGGDLKLVTPAGSLVQRKPVIYQEVDGVRVPVDGSYVIGDWGEVGFRVAPYDQTRPLVIDPVITYSTYLGSSGGTDVVNAIAVDGAGNAYVVGTTSGSHPEVATEPFPWQNGIPSPGNGSGGFVAKLDASGSTLLFASYINGTPWAVALDADGNIYVGGRTFATTFPTTPGAFQSAAPAGSNGFVMKLNQAGNAITWATYVGGTVEDVVTSLAVDSGGAVYVAGTTSSTTFPITDAAPQATYGGGASDAFIAKLAADGGSLVYSTFLGGSGADDARGLALDTANQVYVTGTATAGFPTTPGAFKTSLEASDSSDAFIAKLSGAGGLVYSTLVGGSALDSGRAVDIDASRNAYVTGITQSSDFPTVNAHATSGGKPWWSFAVKLNVAGSSLVYSTYLPETQNAAAIGVDASGAAYIAGHSNAEPFPQVNPIMSGFCDAIDNCAVVTKLNAAGQVTASEYSVVIGKGGVSVRGLALDEAANVFVVGTADHGYTTTPGAYDTTHGQDDNDGFITKLSSNAAASGVTITAADATATEAGPTTGAFKVTRTGSTAAALTVKYSVGGTATAGTDYQALSGTVVIPAGATSATITVTPINDTLMESSETVVAMLTPSAAYTVGTPASARVTISSDETVRISATDPTATEAGLTTGTFTVSRSGAASAALTVKYTVSGTAKAGTDYTALSGSVTIPAGGTSATITVTPINDTLMELSETVVVTLASGTGYTLGSPRSATVTITSDEMVRITASDPTATEAGPTNGAFTVIRTGSTTAALTVFYAVSGTARPGSDYGALSGSVTIPAGATSATILVKPTNDTLPEGSETVVVTLAANAAYTRSTARTATVTIADND